MKFLPQAAVVGTVIAAAAGAHAQSNVTLYGVVDTGIEYMSHANARGQDNVYRVSSGNTAGSRWGLRGKEDLGSGMSAIFALESGFATDTGTSVQGGRLFGRQAWVGLNSAWGRITLGRQVNTLYDLFPAFEPTRYTTYGLLAQDAQFTNRVDNAVKIWRDIGPVAVTALYSTGYDSTIANGSEVPGNLRVGQEMSVGARYNGNALSMAAAYDQRRGTTVASAGSLERRYTTAVSYDFASAGVVVGYRYLQSDLTAPQYRANLYWLGGYYKFHPRLVLRGGAYWNDRRQSGNDTLSYVLALQYGLSRRTMAYANATYVNNRGTATTGAAVGTRVAAGANQTGVVIGIKHIF